MVKVFKPIGAVGKETKTVIQKPDFFAGLITYGQLVGAEGIDQVIYTVPKSTTTFVVSAQMVINSISSISTTNVYLKIGGFRIMRLASVLSTTHTEAVTISFSTPIRLRTGDKIELQTDNAAIANCRGGFMGYEVPTESVPSFT